MPGETLSAVVAVALSPLSPAPVTHSLHRSNPIKPSNALYEFGGILKKKKKKFPVWLQETAPACSPQPALCPVGHSDPNLWLRSFIISPIFSAPLPWDAAKSREWITQSINIIFYPLDTKSVSRCPEPSNLPSDRPTPPPRFWIVLIHFCFRTGTTLTCCGAWQWTGEPSPAAPNEQTNKQTDVAFPLKLASLRGFFFFFF